MEHDPPPSRSWGSALRTESIRQTCTPRADVLEGGLTDAHFAAQLDRIVRRPEEYPSYGDPDSFFSLTYPTQGLRDLLQRAFGRLSGAKVPGAEHGLIRSETSFGGGKTHGLIAAYHVAKGARPDNLAEFVDPAIIPKACQVAAVVGDQLDPANGIKSADRTTYTLWGEIGAQIGDAAFDALKASEEQRTAPSVQTLETAFDGKPTLIIIDEIAQYLRTLTSSGNEDVRRLAQALPVFLKNLLELAASNPNVVVVLTLATNQDAFRGETDALERMTQEARAEAEAAMEDVVSDTTSVVGRFTGGGSIVKPADDVEIGEILKRRLFETIDADAANSVANAYREFYQELASSGETLTGGADRVSEYRDQVARSYPFHPELIRVLDQRLGTIPNFQRARGALKLLAEVVNGIWSDEVDTPILNVGDVYYENPHVLAHVTTGLGRDEFEHVAKSDVVGPSSHARAVDRGSLAGKDSIVRRTAGTVFAHSLEMQASAGAGRPEVVQGTLRPGESPDIAIEALAQLLNTAWYLDFDHNRYRFKTEPNPNAIVAAEQRNLTKSTVAQEMAHRVEEAFPTDKPVTVVHFPTGPQDVSDNPPQLRLVVMHHDALNVQSGDEPPSLLVEMLGKTGASGSTRMNRNAVVFLVADEGQVAGFDKAVSWDLAAQTIVNDAGRMQQFDEQIRKKLHNLADSSRINARVALTRCYKHVFLPSSDRATHYLRHEELPAQSQGEVKQKQTGIVLEYLQQIGKVQVADMGTQYLEAKAWPKDKDFVSTSEMMNTFWRDHGLPLVLNPNLLTSAIQRGVTSGRWVYYDAASEKAYSSQDAPPSIPIREDAYVYTPSAAQEHGLLQMPVRVNDVLDVLAAKGYVDGSEMRTRLEQRIGGEPKKGEVLQVLARAAEGGETARAFVVQGDAKKGEKPLPPSEIPKVGLDTIKVLTKEEAEAAGLDLGRRSVGPKPVEAHGAIGKAFQDVLNQVDDAAWPDGIRSLSVTAHAEVETGLKPIRELHQVVTMLPQFDVRLEARIDLDFTPLVGEGSVHVRGSRGEFEKVEDAVFALADKATEIDGDLTLTVDFADPVESTDAKIEQLRRMLLMQHPGDVTVKAQP